MSPRFRESGGQKDKGWRLENSKKIKGQKIMIKISNECFPKELSVIVIFGEMYMH